MIFAHARLVLVLAGLVAPALILTAGLDAHAATRGAPAPHGCPALPVARVTIKGYAFAPKTRTVAPGTRVTWTNTDSDSHTIVSDTGVFMASDNVSAGQSFTHTFGKTGTFTYHCGLHAFMISRVVVKSPTHATP